MKLSCNTGIYKEMLSCAREEAPLEACGLIGGNDGRVSVFYRLVNIDASSDHFTMAPEEQFAAIKDMRAKGIEMLGIWHSHPSTPARMSEEDLRLAYTPGVAYMILSLAQESNPELKAFVLENDVPAEVEVVIEE